MGACDAADKGFLLSQMLHEINTGDCTIENAKARRDNGGYSIPMIIYIDAMSVFAAVTASFIKIPADNGMLSHVQYLRELLDSRVLTAICWTDTRDMVADGATKGSIDRKQVHTCLSGTSEINLEIKLWQAKRQTAQHRSCICTCSHFVSLDLSQFASPIFQFISE